MGSVAVILLMGRLYREFQIKWLLFGTFVIFEIGSAICGAAQNLDMLIAGRVIAGLGGSGMYLGYVSNNFFIPSFSFYNMTISALTYLNVFTTERERPIYNASIGLAWGAGAILGPVIGGAFSVSNATWRWAFYINLPLAACLLPVYIWIAPLYNAGANKSTRSKLMRIDWLGTILNAGIFIMFVVALIFSGTIYKWGSGSAITLWVVMGVLVILFGIQQAFCIFTTSQDRLLPVQFLKSRTMVLVYIGTACAAAANGVFIYYIPLFFQFTKGDTALKAAVRLLPFIIPYITFVMISGGLLPVIGRYAPFYLVGGILILIGGVLQYRVTSTTPVGHIYGWEILAAAGTGIVWQTGYTVAGSKVKEEDVGAAIGYINVSQIGTTCIALAIAGSLFSNHGVIELNHALGSYNLPPAYLSGALAGKQSAIFTTGEPAVQQLALEAVVKTISTVFIIVIPAGALLIICSLLMRWEKLKFKAVGGG